MKPIDLFVIYSFAILYANGKRKRHGHKAPSNGSKRSKDAATPVTYGRDVISNYATENTPVFWRDLDNINIKRPSKKTEEGEADGGFELEPDAVPNTVGPNENIYGGFPINDVLGGFELPSPETLAILKAALKKYGPRDEYEAKLHHNLENWAYGYEHHALPEYDVKETPPFYVKMLEGLKMAEKGEKKPGCSHPGATCGMASPVFHLNDDQCNTLAGNCMASKPITSGYEEPCPWKIIEMLFGCKKPKKPASDPAVAGKPDGVEPPAPKPDAPEAPKPEAPKPEAPKPEAAKKPPEEKEVKEEGEKPKPIPIQLEEGHATPAHIDKQVQDIKDDAKTAKGVSKSPDNGLQYAKLNSQLGLLSFLKTAASSKQDPQSRTGFANPDANATTTPTSLPPSAVTSQQTKSSSMDPEFSEWSKWSACTVTCGRGSISRTRGCLHWKCDGKVIDLKACDMQTCPDYLMWTAWSPCDAPCGTGRERRTRECSGIRCSGISSQERSCFRDPCQPNLNLPPTMSKKLMSSVGAPWGKWSGCTSRCGFGVQTRKRDCKVGNCNLNSNLVQTKICLKQSCTDSGGKVMSKTVQDACLYIHNSYRLSHGVGELIWKEYLAEAATKIAKELASKSASVVDVRDEEVPGTSIMLMPTGDFSDVGMEAACYTAAKSWYAEQKSYDFNNPHLTNENMHFTQMIWKGTRDVGFGVAISKASSNLYFVAKYDPPGNQDTYVGFRKNALPLQSSLRIDETTVVKRLK